MMWLYRPSVLRTRVATNVTLLSHPNAIHSYITFRDELTIEDAIILKVSKAVIPKSIQNKYINIMAVAA